MDKKFSQKKEGKEKEQHSADRETLFHFLVYHSFKFQLDLINLFGVNIFGCLKYFQDRNKDFQPIVDTKKHLLVLFLIGVEFDQLLEHFTLLLKLIDNLVK